MKKLTQKLKSHRSRIADDHGFSMIPAVTAVFVGSLISLGAWTAAQGDLGLQNQDRYGKMAYTQAESGVTDYVQHMAEDAGYWQFCDQLPGLTGNGVGQTAVNDIGRTGTTGSTARRWLPQPTVNSIQDQALTAQYTIDLLPTNGTTSCDANPNRAETMVDKTTGTIRVRVTGRAGPPAPSTSNIATWRQNEWKRRSIVIEFRRKGFLDYAYFTDKEGKDPSIQAAPRNVNCNAYYSPNVGAPNTTSRFYWNGNSGRPDCGEIMFADYDEIHGPFHTNDGALIESHLGPEFGNAGKNDVVEVFDDRCPFRTTSGSDVTRTHRRPNGVTDTASGYFNVSCQPASGAGSVRPLVHGPVLIGAAASYLPLPESNADLLLYADESTADPFYRGIYTEGPTTILLKPNGKLDITNPFENSGNTQVDVDWPPSGVIYVANRPGTSSCPYDAYTDYPSLPPGNGCGYVEVKGTYSSPLTITAESDVIVTGNVRKDAASDTAVLGLIATNFARVRHYGTAGNCGNATNTSANPAVNYIDAAILTLNHSFTVDRYDCGSGLGDLHLSGVLAQAFRGTVRSGSSGYAKDYNYDYRYKYLTPPHFLVPTLSTWRISRYREQVPACACT